MTSSYSRALAAKFICTFSEQSISTPHISHLKIDLNYILYVRRYYSAKTYQVGLGIHHRTSHDHGKSWTKSSTALSMNASVTPTPGGGAPVETIAGKFFPEALGAFALRFLSKSTL